MKKNNNYNDEWVITTIKLIITITESQRQYTLSARLKKLYPLRLPATARRSSTWYIATPICLTTVLSDQTAHKDGKWAEPQANQTPQELKLYSVLT